MSTKPKQTKKSGNKVVYDIRDDIRALNTKIIRLQNSLNKKEIEIAKNKKTTQILCIIIIFSVIALLITYYGSQMKADQDAAANDKCADNAILLKELESYVLQFERTMNYSNRSLIAMNSTIKTLSEIAEIEPERIKPEKGHPRFQKSVFWPMVGWIIYYAVKLIGQAAAEFCLCLQFTSKDNWLYMVGIIVASHLLVELLYFDLFTDIVLILAYLITECVLMLLLNGLPYHGPYYILGSFIMAQMNVLYWRLWKGDDIYLVIAAMLATYSLFVSYWKGMFDYCYLPGRPGYKSKTPTMVLLFVFLLCNAGMIIHELYRLWNDWNLKDNDTLNVI